MLFLFIAAIKLEVFDDQETSKPEVSVANASHPSQSICKRG